MDSVNMHEAKTRLSALVEAIESGAEAEVVIARNGKPVARLVPMPKRKPIRLGLAEGKFVAPENLDEYEDEIIAMFENDGEL